MQIDDHIWKLAEKKLISEASESELQELDTLLNKDPDMNKLFNTIFEWWDEDNPNSANNNSERLFNKILHRIKK